MWDRKCRSGGPVRSLLTLIGQETMVAWWQWRWGKVILRTPLEVKLVQFADGLATGNQGSWRDQKRRLIQFSYILACLSPWIFLSDPHNYPCCGYYHPHFVAGETEASLKVRNRSLQPGLLATSGHLESSLLNFLSLLIHVALFRPWGLACHPGHSPFPLALGERPG